MIASCANVFNVRIFFQMRACVVMSEWRRCLTITTVYNLCMLRPSMLRKAVCGYSRTGGLLSCNERVVCMNCVSCYKKKYNYSVTPLGPQQRSPYPPWTMSGRRWTRLKTRIRVTHKWTTFCYGCVLLYHEEFAKTTWLPDEGCRITEHANEKR